jgi:hypothetical protein
MASKRIELDAFDLPPPKPRPVVAEEKAVAYERQEPAPVAPPPTPEPIADELAEEPEPSRSARPAAANFAPKKTPKKEPSKRRRPDHFDGARVNVYLPIELEERLRELAFREKRSISHAVTEAVELLLAKKNRGQK